MANFTVLPKNLLKSSRNQTYKKTKIKRTFPQMRTIIHFPKEFLPFTLKKKSVFELFIVQKK